MKAVTSLAIFLLIGFCRPYESPYEDKYHCMRDGEIIGSEEKVLILSPHDKYFFKTLGIGYPTGTVMAKKGKAAN